MRRFAPLGFVLAAGLLGAAPAPAQLPGPVVGHPAPDFSVTTVDGKHLRLADFRGKVLVVNVWGSWCPPCRLETPDLVAQAKHDAGRVAFLGIDTTEPASVVRAFAAAKDVPYPQVATTSTSAFARDYDIRNYPTTFVIDAGGVLRARHADNLLPRAQLQAYIAAAQRGQSAPLASAFQRELDGWLDPAKFTFTGEADSVRKNVQSASDVIDKANAALDDAMDDPSRDHDLIATQREEETLRAAAIAALMPIATADADKLLLARLQGDEDAAFGRWADADAAYGRALAIDPADVASLSGRAYAVSQLNDRARVVEIDEQLAKLEPTSAPAFVALGRAQAAAGNVADAETSFEHARTLAAGDAARLAWTNLYEGRMETAAGNSVKARAAFLRAQTAAADITRSDPRATWYTEQAQEGIVALGVAPGAAPSVSLAPWTGPDLPGSIDSTYKYRLVVTGAAGRKLTLAAAGLPPKWIGSFCTDRVCAPFRTTVVMPPNGVKIVEFQVVPFVAADAERRQVGVEALQDGRRVASTTVTLARPQVR